MDVYSATGPGVDFTLSVPHNLSGPDYIEIGYRMAQLGDEQFPQHYACLSDTETKLFKHKRGDPLPVNLVDSCPHGLK